MQGAIVLIAFAGYLVLRPGHEDIRIASEAERLINNNRPTMVEFFSNYCLGCMTYRPEVDQIIEHFQDEMDVIRIDIHTELGRDLRARLGFSFTPEFILYNSSGQEVWRGHIPPSRVELELIQS